MVPIRNVAIIAHVDHGKTTLVDVILRQTKIFRDNQDIQDCVLDNNDLERERGITILSKNISVRYRDTKINVIDTPGHSDFGGQVERVLNLADGVLLLVDAFEGPMPQTRFVLEKALELKLFPIVVINKIDKPMARPSEVLDEIYGLFIDLNASDEQLDFPIVYASGKHGWASLTPDKHEDNIIPLLDTIIDKVPAPKVQEGPVQMQITTLDYSDYLGRIGIGRVYRGTMRITDPMVLIKADESQQNAALKQLYTFEGLGRTETKEVGCGDLCAIAGIENIDIGDTIADAREPQALGKISIDEPTISMLFRANDGPFFGKEGKYVTSRHIRERLFKEVERDVSYRVDDSRADEFKVSGRGVLHLAILIETMRREGYEMTISQPQVIMKIIDGQKMEPVESLIVDVPGESASKVIEAVGLRRGEMLSMEVRGDRQRLEFKIPTRGLVGLKSKLLTVTAGEAVMSHRFIEYQPYKGEIQQRQNGVLISMDEGPIRAYAIDNLQQRGVFFVGPNENAYEGMIVGENSKSGDMIVNVQRAKQLTNIRASGSDKAIRLIPPRLFSLEDALEYINEDELVEVTPQSIRLRKRYLKEVDRKRNRHADAVAESALA